MRQFCFLSLQFLASSLPLSAAADVIVLRADPWCPFTCEPKSDQPGYMVEIAREALAPFGHQIDYQNMNWARALSKAAEGEIDGVIGTIPEEVPGFLISDSMGTYANALAFRLGESFPFDNVSQLDGMRLGAINGYDYYGPVNEYIQANESNIQIIQYASGIDALQTSLRKLVSDRVDIVSDDVSVLQYTASQLGILDQIEVVLPEGLDDIHIAFSPNIENAALYNQQLNEGLAMLRASGRVDEIRSKYGL